MRLLLILLSLVLVAGRSAAQLKQVPPPGNQIRPGERADLESGLAKLDAQIEALRRSADPAVLALLPDVEVFRKAVQWPLKYGEIIDVAKARRALAIGAERAASLREGRAPWVTGGGVRAYRSRIDDSVQPYILMVPPGYGAGDGKRYRLDFFCHGRDERLMELNFILGRAAGSGDAAASAPADRFVVHPYGRYCNANKFAGEVDVLEVLDALKRQYPIDEDRVVMTGFSMGGASAWHLAVHYPDNWAAASPGAGFAETARYQKLAQKGLLDAVPWYEKRLWHLYDCPDWAANLTHCPTIAYAGDMDPQKQAGDVMEAAMAREGLKLERVWGEKTGHKYEPAAKKLLDARLDELASRGRERMPRTVRFITWTLRYNRMHWVRVDALARHGEEARVEAARGEDGVTATTRNVDAISFVFPASEVPFAAGAAPRITIDGTSVTGPAAVDGAAYEVRLERGQGGWKLAGRGEATLRKRHGLQGPIDDGFMGRFVMVRPTGEAMSDAVGRWTTSEFERAVAQWRQVFRGEAIVKADKDITDADMAQSTLILWGDASSNRVLSRIADRLPVKWGRDGLVVGPTRYDADHHVPVLIYPNPLGPDRYVVLNSGFTFREGAAISNSLQTPRLPDWAVVDIRTPADHRRPGKIVEAGFFDERWRVQAPR